MDQICLAIYKSWNFRELLEKIQTFWDFSRECFTRKYLETSNIQERTQEKQDSREEAPIHLNETGKDLEKFEEQANEILFQAGITANECDVND